MFLKLCGPYHPQLLILDCQSSHQSIGLLECAIQNQFMIVCLPPHTTQFLQPLDRCTFSPFSIAYNQVYSEFLLNPAAVISKATWPSLLCKSWQAAFTGTNIKSGFRGRGIYPLNPSAIPDSPYEPSTILPSNSEPTPLPSTSPEPNPLPSMSSDSSNNLMVLAEAAAMEDRVQPQTTLSSPKICLFVGLV